MTFNSGSILRMWVGRRGSSSWVNGYVVGIVNEGKTMEKGKSILWYSLGPRTALVTTATAAVDDDDDDEKKESVCAAKTGVWHLFSRTSTSSVLSVAYHLSSIMVSYALGLRKI